MNRPLLGESPLARRWIWRLARLHHESVHVDRAVILHSFRNRECLGGRIRCVAIGAWIPIPVRQSLLGPNERLGVVKIAELDLKREVERVLIGLSFTSMILEYDIWSKLHKSWSNHRLNLFRDEHVEIHLGPQCEEVGGGTLGRGNLTIWCVIGRLCRLSEETRDEIDDHGAEEHWFDGCHHWPLLRLLSNLSVDDLLFIGFVMKACQNSFFILA